MTAQTRRRIATRILGNTSVFPYGPVRRPARSAPPPVGAALLQDPPRSALHVLGPPRAPGRLVDAAAEARHRHRGRARGRLLPDGEQLVAGHHARLVLRAVPRRPGEPRREGGRARDGLRGLEVQRRAALRAPAALEREAQLLGEGRPSLREVVVALGRLDARDPQAGLAPEVLERDPVAFLYPVSPLEDVVAVFGLYLLEEYPFYLVPEALVVPAEPARDEGRLAQVAPDLVGPAGQGELDDHHGADPTLGAACPPTSRPRSRIWRPRPPATAIPPTG